MEFAKELVDLFKRDNFTYRRGDHDTKDQMMQKSFYSVNKFLHLQIFIKSISNLYLCEK